MVGFLPFRASFGAFSSPDWALIYCYKSGIGKAGVDNKIMKMKEMYNGAHLLGISLNSPLLFSSHYYVPSNRPLLYFTVSFSWSSDGRFCRVVKEGDNYVECACSHLSVYAAHAEFASLASYNEAFYASGFVCISGH